MSYQYPASQQQQQQQQYSSQPPPQPQRQPVFDLDDLLGDTQPVPRPQQQHAPPPSGPPPPPVSQDPFFGTTDNHQQQQQQQQQQPPQQQQQPQFHQPPPPTGSQFNQPQSNTSYQQSMYPPMQPQGGSPQQYQQQQPTNTPQAPLQQTQPTMTGTSQHPQQEHHHNQQHPPPPQQQHYSPPPAPQNFQQQSHPPQQQQYYQGQVQQPPQQPPQQQPPQHYAPPTYAPPESFYPQEQAQQVRPTPGGMQPTPSSVPDRYAAPYSAPQDRYAPSTPPATPYDDDADRRQLEKIKALREQLEREQQKEQEKKDSQQAAANTWACPQCTFRNKMEVTTCEVCEEARPGFSSAKKPEAKHAPPRPTPAVPSNAPSPNEWACSGCTLHNPASASRCTACDKPRPGFAPPPSVSAIPATPGAAPHAGEGGEWSCPTCTFLGNAGALKCPMCDTPRPGVSAELLALANQQQEILNRQRRRAIENRASRRVPAATRQPAQAPAEPEQDDAEEVQWQKDTDATNCNKCASTFGLVNRRHHCRSCGFIFCKNCSNNKVKLKTDTAERVCIDCYREKTTPKPAAKPAVAAQVRQPTARPPQDPELARAIAESMRDAPPPVQRPQPQTHQPSPQRTAGVKAKCGCAMGEEGFHGPACPLASGAAPPPAGRTGGAGAKANCACAMGEEGFHRPGCPYA